MVLRERAADTVTSTLSVAHAAPASPRTGRCIRHLTGRTDRRAAMRAVRTVYVPSRIETVMSPHSSVRRIREPPRDSCATVAALGCPNLLPLPTLMSAYSGRSAVITGSLTASKLPWCPTLSTSMSVSTPCSTSGSRTTLSASPVSTAENPFDRTRRTRLDSFADGSRTAASGETTVTSTDPTVNPSPATS